MKPNLSPTLVVVAGPQASGKSTLALALGEDLRQAGERVALVELDQIAAMALPTLPDWATAHRIFESVTHQWLRSELTCVIAEGSGSYEEVLRLLNQGPATTASVTVALTAPVNVAFERAQRDLSRGGSRESETSWRVSTSDGPRNSVDSSHTCSWTRTRPSCQGALNSSGSQSLPLEKDKGLANVHVNPQPAGR